MHSLANLEDDNNHIKGLVIRGSEVIKWLQR